MGWNSEAGTRSDSSRRMPLAGCTSTKGCNGMTTSWERGRPARTRLGTASTLSPTSINRERRPCSPPAWLMRLPPTGSLPAASIARLATRGISGQSGAPWRRTPFKRAGWGRPGTGRGAFAWNGQDAGGTPALPGDDARLRGGGWRATSQKSDVHPSWPGLGVETRRANPGRRGVVHG